MGPGFSFAFGARSTTPTVTWSPALLSTGVEYWLAEDLSATGNGVAVTGNWAGKQLGAIFSPFATDQGTYRSTAFIGDGALVTAGLQQATKASKCVDAAITTIFNGTNKVYTCWWLGQLDVSSTSVYWGAGDLTSVTEHVYCRYSGTGVIKNQMVSRDGALNVADSMTEFQTLAPQLLEFQRAAGGVWSFIKDGISEGGVTRSDAGVAVGQLLLGGTPNGSSSAAVSSHTISAFGITTGLSAGDQANLRLWAAQRLGMLWKKGLNP